MENIYLKKINIVKNKDLHEGFQLTNTMIISSPEMKFQFGRILVQRTHIEKNTL